MTRFNSLTAAFVSNLPFFSLMNPFSSFPLCRLVKVTAALHLRMMDLLIDGVVGKQILRRVKVINPSVVKHKDPVCGFDAGQPLGDDDLRRARDLFCKCRPDLCVCGRIDRTGGIIQDQDLRFLQKRSGNTESLFLTAGYVGAAPLDPRLIAARHPVDKFIGAGCLTCFHALLIGGVRVTPAQVIKNRSGKQRILLQYHGYLISQHSVSYLRTSTPPTQTLPSSTS